MTDEKMPATEKEQLKKMGLGLVAGFAVPVLVVVLIVQYVMRSQTESVADHPAMSAEAVAKRIKPIGELRVEGAPAAEAGKAAAARSGEQVVKAACSKCHESGEGGAPRLGDKAAWAKRLSGGVDATTNSAIKGHGGMPARGGFADLTDAEVRAAILYMYSASGVEVKKAEAAPAPAAPPPPPAAEKTAAAPAAAPAAAEPTSGEEIYKSVCSACHDTGAANAPKLGDKAAWAPRLAQGLDTLTENAIKGKGAMPPKGGKADLSDGGIALAVIYIAGKAGGAAPAPAAAAPKAETKAPAKAAAAAPAADAGGKGKDIYTKTCAACHMTGAAGAPKLGDKAAWGPRIAQGKDALYTSALKGKGAMPPKGGNAALPDADVKAVVDYMVSQAK